MTAEVAPPRCAVESHIHWALSPKFTDKSCTLMPVATVTWTVRVVELPAWPGFGDWLTTIPGRGTGTTATDVDTAVELPAASVRVAVTILLPWLLYVCAPRGVPVTAPRSVVSPSPQRTMRSRTALPLAAAAVIAKVKFAGSPTLGGVVGGVMTSVGAVEMLTV